MKNIDFKKISFILFILAPTFQVVAQSKIEIRYLSSWDNEKSVEFTKENLKKYEIYLIIDTLELKVEKISDSLLIGPTLTNEQRVKIMNEENVKVKLYDGKHCLISWFPNVFIHKTDVLKIDFYKVNYVTKISGKTRNVFWKKRNLGINYINWHNRQASEIIYPCK
ncbi:MAG: hypothetical protein ABI207_03225 [Crocinitomicaceae bacterium]